MPNNEQQNNVQKKTNLEFFHFIFLEKKEKFFFAFLPTFLTFLKLLLWYILLCFNFFWQYQTGSNMFLIHFILDTKLIKIVNQLIKIVNPLYTCSKKLSIIMDGNLKRIQQFLNYSCLKILRNKIGIWWWDIKMKMPFCC